MSEISLAVKGKIYTGWQEVKISKSMSGLTSSFSLALTDKFPGKMRSWGFKEGNICEVKINKKQVVKGYIEDIDIDYSKDSHSIVVSGRDAMCDIVDGSYDYDDTVWENVKLYMIIKELLARYGIGLYVDPKVSDDASTVVPKFTATRLDDLSELLSQLCKHKALLACSYGDGKLSLTRSGGNGVCKDYIALGYNVLEGGLHSSDKDRYSEYTIVGQGASREDKDLPGYIEPVGRWEDSTMSRPRFLVIPSDRATDAGECEKLAKWEASIRAGRSRQYRYKLQGWTQSSKYGGAVWPLNSKVKVNDYFLNVKDTLLITDLDFSMSLDGGTTTVLTLSDPRAYELVEQPIDIKTDFDEDD